MTKNDPISNYFVVNRCLLSSDRWLSEPFTRGQAWVDMFGLAQHTKGYFRIRGIRVNVERGQLAYSQVTLAKRWQWSRDKVRRYLKELENNKDIIQQNNEVTTLITIIKYDYWQGNNTTNDTTEKHQKNIRKTSNDTHKKKNKKKKKDNKDNKYIAKNSFREESQVFSFDQWLGGVIANKQPHIALIGRYLKYKNAQLASKKVANDEIKRWVKDARYLADFSEERIQKTIKKVESKYPDMWNLSTVRKEIAYG